MCDTCGCTVDVTQMSGAEQVKARSNRLRGTLSDELLEDTRVFSDDAEVILKFHGVYQQDDRDLRKEARKLGLDKHHVMMIRTRIPGGIVTPDAYLAHDRIAGAWGNDTLRITTARTCSCTVSSRATSRRRFAHQRVAAHHAWRLR